MSATRSQRQLTSQSPQRRVWVSALGAQNQSYEVYGPFSSNIAVYRPRNGRCCDSVTVMLVLPPKLPT